MRRNLRWLFSTERGGQMPRKPMRPCSHPGCPNLTEGRFCEEHVKLQNHNYERYERNPQTKRKYGRAWKRIRDREIKEKPYCQVCLSKGIMVEAEEVHHKVPLSEGGTHARENLVCLCASCHSRLHAERGDRWSKDRQYSY